MTMEVPPKGTRGANAPRSLLKLSQGLMVWFGRRAGDGMVILTTVGAKSGRPHTVAINRFPDGGSAFVVVASNMGSARHPAWYINMAKNPDQVWAEVGKRKFKVRPQLLKGAERQAALQRVTAAAPNYGAYQQNTDRELPVVRLVPEE